MKIKNFFILLLACALLFAGCKVETDAPDSPASPAPSAAPTDFVLYRADSFRIGSQAYEKCSFNEDISKKYALINQSTGKIYGINEKIIETDIRNATELVLLLCDN